MPESIDHADIVEYVEETYNDFISVFEFENFVRVTNGSAGHQADLVVSDGQLSVRAHRYGESYEGDHEATIDGLETALAEGLGL